jgi:beta-phosphoglucomutase-like phosphatase (HAD superfamily)
MILAMFESEAPAALRLELQRGLALIFDLDGVVVDSMPVHALAWRRYLKDLGISGSDVEDRMHGRRNDEIVRDFLGAGADESSVPGWRLKTWISRYSIFFLRSWRHG